MCVTVVINEFYDFDTIKDMWLQWVGTLGIEDKKKKKKRNRKRKKTNDTKR